MPKDPKKKKSTKKKAKTAARGKTQQAQPSESLYRALLESIPDIMFALDSEGKILYLNQGFGELSSKELLGKSFFTVIPKKYHERLKETLEAALSNPDFGTYDAAVVMPDKKTIYWSMRLEEIGEARAFLISGKDITERIRVEDQGRESESKFRLIFENANDMIVFIDTEGMVLDINDQVEDMFGLKRLDIIGKNFFQFDVLSQEDMDNSIEILKDIFEGIPAPLTEFRAFHKNRSVLYIEANCKLIIKDDEMLGVLIIIRDITKRKRIEADLEQYRNHLEELVEERTINLEDANTALKVILKKRDEDKNDMEDKILSNVNELVFPYLDFLEGSKLSSRQKAHVDIIKSNLNDIVSPFVKGISSKHLKLTPTEIKIANLVKHGKTTKEIAEMLCLAIKTIEFHRENIRKKLGINKQKVNLRTYLMSIQ